MSGKSRNYNYANFRKRKPDSAFKLGDVATVYVEKNISPRQKKFEKIFEIWSQVLPEDLIRNCEIENFSNGVLTIVTNSPVYSHEMRLCSCELMEFFKQQCPQARIEKIKVKIGLPVYHK